MKKYISVIDFSKKNSAPKELRIMERYYEIIERYKQNIGEDLYCRLIDDYLIEITSRRTEKGTLRVLSIRNNDNVDRPIPLFIIEDIKMDRYKDNSYLESLFQLINSLEFHRFPIDLNTEGEVLTLDFGVISSTNKRNA